MKTFTKARVREVSDKIQALLDELSKKEGIQIKMNGGNFSGDTFNLKIQGKLLNDEGDVFVSDSTNSYVDQVAKNAGISFTSPHFLGSIWRLRSSGLVRVIDHSSKNRKYPFIIKVYEEDKCLKTTAMSFVSGTEVPPPTHDEFFKWFTIDPEDDAISRSDEMICDRVNDYVSVKFADNGSIGDLFDACANYFDNVAGNAKKDREVSDELYRWLINLENVSTALIIINSKLS